MDEMIQVGGQSVAVLIAQTSKNLWTVRGIFDASSIVVSAANRRTAIHRWRRAAEQRASAQST